MIEKVFAVRDSKAQAFLQPFYSVSVGSAVRAFGDAANEKNSMVSKHPEDYLLYELGEFDNNTGAFKSISPIVLLGCAKDFVANPAQLQEQDALINEVINGSKKVG